MFIVKLCVIFSISSSEKLISGGFRDFGVLLINHLSPAGPGSPLKFEHSKNITIAMSRISSYSPVSLNAGLIGLQMSGGRFADTNDSPSFLMDCIEARICSSGPRLVSFRKRASAQPWRGWLGRRQGGGRTRSAGGRCILAGEFRIRAQIPDQSTGAEDGDHDEENEQETEAGFHDGSVRESGRGFKSRGVGTIGSIAERQGLSNAGEFQLRVVG